MTIGEAAARLAERKAEYARRLARKWWGRS